MHTALTLDSSSGKALPRLRYQPKVDQLLQEGQVELKALACPINPIDLLVLKDMYPVKPKNLWDGDKIFGYDGVFEVVKSQASSLGEGDYVIPREHGFGTWRTHATTGARDLLKIPRIDPRAAAILKMGACPAYLLLEDIVPLKPGDWIIQNAGTSVIGQFLVQYAKMRNVHTVSVIRDRPDFASVKLRLENLGADLVISESDLHCGGCKALEGKNIVLGLDCVFGSSGEAIAKSLAAGGTYVIFGLLGGGSLNIGPDVLFFKGVTFRNFRLSKSLTMRSVKEVDALLVCLADHFAKGDVKLPELDAVQWSKVNDEAQARQLEKRLLEAVEKARRGDVGKKKIIFSFE
ncbi:hypothetical protein M422DRAFT_35564 [Sphaerobolus stellatus SS14]|uniref:enoyl-[acyl-carrier-protein] reductase n=1 Tax=Sphaerobolus stellatus (strain SS14) TaxID=990650 RepID=A0A0C9UVA3_SPHS4|nr:hypothetical protein M422DRAFT_35564 [Sphaerobolus stellatus SS14]